MNLYIACTFSCIIYIHLLYIYLYIVLYNMYIVHYICLGSQYCIAYCFYYTIVSVFIWSECNYIDCIGSYVQFYVNSTQCVLYYGAIHLLFFIISVGICIYHGISPIFLCDLNWIAFKFNLTILLYI